MKQYQEPSLKLYLMANQEDVITASRPTDAVFDEETGDYLIPWGE